MVIIKEAFQSGSSQKIVQKIVSVVNKKVSGQILLSDIGYGYQNQDGILIKEDRWLQPFAKFLSV